MKRNLSAFAYALSVLWGVVTIVFFLFNVLPSDPARITMGQRSDLATIENVRKELHLDKPVWKRYLLYLNDLSPISLHQDNVVTAQKYDGLKLFGKKESTSLFLKTPYLGRSYQSKKLVSTMLSETIPGTLVLAFAAMLFATFFGIALGVIAAIKKGTFWDSSAIIASIAGISTPSFFAGLIIAYIGGYLLKDYTGLNMTGSLWEYDINGNKYFSLKNLILPALTLGIRPLAIIAQLTRSALLDVLHQDYIRTAYAKGLKKWQVIWRHALPNALIPVVTAISGWLAELLAGSFFVEYIFGWKGLGKLTVESLEKFDFPVVTGAILISAAIFIIVNMLTDLLYKKIDPRIR